MARTQGAVWRVGWCYRCQCDLLTSERDASFGWVDTATGEPVYDIEFVPEGVVRVDLCSMCANPDRRGPAA